MGLEFVGNGKAGQVTRLGMKGSVPAAGGQEQTLSSVLSRHVFPGRNTVYVHEVANTLRISVPQVISLINEGLLDAVQITGRGNKTTREHWRIPVSAYDEYIRRRRNCRPELRSW